MSILFVALLSSLGVATGFLAGLLGIGGGMLLVPCLTMLFSAEGFPPQHVLHMAVATSLSTIMFTSLSSVRAHHRRAAVRWDLLARMAAGAFFGTLAGAQLAGLLRGRWLALSFALLAGYSGVQMMRSARRTTTPATMAMPGVIGLNAAGFGIGAISSVVGAGGGFITVPFLRRCRVTIREAVGTSAALGFPIAAGGLVGYLIAGRHVEGLPRGALGYVYLPALAVCSLASVVTAPLGVRAANALPVASLEKIFASLLIGLSLYMVWRATL